MHIQPDYRGRFAPSPTGPLHFGSLVAAVGSFLDARHHGGTWSLRMEDLDTPRCVAGAAGDVLRTLERFQLEWDGPVLYQSQRTVAYEEALAQLQASGAAYLCCCTRKEIADSALHGIEGVVYPGTCRCGIPAGREGRAWRVQTGSMNPVRTERSADAWSRSVAGTSTPLALPATLIKPLAIRLGCQQTVAKSLVISTNGVVAFTDTLQGQLSQNLEQEIGDFVVKRADGLFAYQLAVVVDDAFQGITHVVRGSDLLTSTPRQIWLQRLLGLPTPVYMHLPVAVNAGGEKLSKQTLAMPVDVAQAAETLWRVLSFLQQTPPPELAHDLPNLLAWAVENWRSGRLHGLKALPALA